MVTQETAYGVSGWLDYRRVLLGSPVEGAGSVGAGNGVDVGCRSLRGDRKLSRNLWGKRSLTGMDAHCWPIPWSAGAPAPPERRVVGGGGGGDGGGALKIKKRKAGGNRNGPPWAAVSRRDLR